MKKIVIITDGDDFRAYRLKVVKSEHGAGIKASEIRLPGRAHAGRSRTLFREALRGGLPDQVRLRQRGPLEDRVIGDMAGRVEKMLRKERPEVWNLVAPPELMDGLVEAVDPVIRKQLACVHLEDLLAIIPDEGAFRVDPAHN